MGRISPTRHEPLQLSTSTQTDFLGQKEERLLKELAAAAEWCIRDFKSQALANTAWAFATVGYEEERHFTALAAATKWLVRNFSAGSYEHSMGVRHNWTEGRTFVHSVGQEGCQSMNTALSFYGVVQQEERLFTVLAAAAVSESGVRDWNS